VGGEREERRGRKRKDGSSVVGVLIRNGPGVISGGFESKRRVVQSQMKQGTKETKK
jgi:hypothetical protein